MEDDRQGLSQHWLAIWLLTLLQKMVAEGVPFSEPPWLNQLPSAIYTNSHRQWQKHCRTFFEDVLFKHALDWEREEEVPAEVYGALCTDQRYPYPRCSADDGHSDFCEGQHGCPQLSIA